MLPDDVLYYKVSVRRGHFNVADPSQLLYDHTVEIYRGDERIYSIAVADEDKLFDEDATVDDVIEGLESYLDNHIYSSIAPRVQSVIDFFREHRDELELGRQVYELDRTAALLQDRTRKLIEEIGRLRKVFEE